MSDPMTNSDIEDVLSSIRRLVSQDPVATTPGVAVTGAQPSAPAPPPRQAPEKLVLTPSQRVEPAPGAGPGTPEMWHGDDEPADKVERSAANDRVSLEQTIAELEAAVSGYQEEWEPDGSEILSVPQHKDGMPEADSAAAAETGPEAQISDAHARDPGASAGSGMTPHNVWPFSPARSVQPQNDGPSQGSATTPGEPLAALPEAADAAGVSDAGIAPSEDLPSVPFDEGEAILDEETLREVVSQIVREELQGELGERITRNVRKLVRSEIARALASREFD